MSAELCEDLIVALGAALIRKGVLTADDMVDAADREDQRGAAQVAHALRIIVLKAAEPSIKEWHAEQRRARMHVIDGGNAD